MASPRKTPKRRPSRAVKKNSGRGGAGKAKIAVKSQAPRKKAASRLREAIRLRDEGELAASRELLIQLLYDNPDDPLTLYHTAWTHDRMGREQEAVGFYERAIAVGLKGDDLAGAYLGLGSTLRGLGEYGRALEVLDRGVGEFPERTSLRVFRAMVHYNLGLAKDSVSELLQLLATTSADPDIAQFQRALLFYSRDLDRVWSS